MKRNILLSYAMILMLCLSCTGTKKDNVQTTASVAADVTAEDTVDVDNEGEDTGCNMPEELAEYYHLYNPDNIDYNRKIDSVLAVCKNLSHDDYMDTQDSLMANVVYPKPEVELICDGEKGHEVARRVQNIYDDVLESQNYLMRFKSKDFFKLYWTKSLYAAYKKAEKISALVIDADPYTGTQGHGARHLHKVEVISVDKNKASVKVCYGSLDREGIFLYDINLRLLYERNDWYIDDMQDGITIWVRDEIKEVCSR